MSRPVSLVKDASAPPPNFLGPLRRDFGLTLFEAAKALGLSPTQLEREELKDVTALSVEGARAKFENFVSSGRNAEGKNLIFSALPLRVARDIMNCSVEEIAARYGMSPSHWRKLECHSRALAPDMLEQIEEDVRVSFGNLCEPVSDSVNRTHLQIVK